MVSHSDIDMIHFLQPKYNAQHDPSHERTAIDEKSVFFIRMNQAKRNG